MKRTVFAAPYLVWMGIFIAVPMLFIFYSAFFDGGVFTTKYVETVFKDTLYMQVLLRSVWLALKATAFCLVLGYPIAYILSKMKPAKAALWSLLFILPMWMNFLLRTYAWQVLLNDNGIIASILRFLGAPQAELLYTEGAVLMGTIYNFLPFMILPIYTVLIKLDKSHVEAAYDLGANGFITFTKVIFPLSLPGVVSGITMVFIPAITTFAISRLLGGGKVRLYGDLIEQKIVSEGNLGIGSVLSIVLLVLVVISMVIMKKAEGEDSNAGGTLW